MPEGRTRGEIETLVAKYGATRFASGWLDDNKSAISFVAHGRLVRFVLPLPTRDAILARLKKLQAYQWRTPADGTIDNALAAERRRRWRCLLLGIKMLTPVGQDGVP